MIRSALMAAIALGVALGPSAAWSTPIALNETINLIFDGANGVGGTGPNPDVHGIGSITVTALSSTSVTFDISLTNAGTLTAAGTRFAAFGFAMTPAPTPFPVDIATSDSGGLSDTDRFIDVHNGGLPGFPVINVCAYVSTNCSAGSGGLLTTETDEFSFSLSGTFGNSVDLSLITLRVTGCGGGGVPCPSGIPEGEGPSGTPGPIPLPGTLVLLGLGLSGFMVAERLRSLRRKK